MFIFSNIEIKVIQVSDQFEFKEVSTLFELSGIAALLRHIMPSQSTPILLYIEAKGWVCLGVPVNLMLQIMSGPWMGLPLQPQGLGRASHHRLPMRRPQVVPFRRHLCIPRERLRYSSNYQVNATPGVHLPSCAWLR